MANQATAGWDQWDGLFGKVPHAEIARQSGKTLNAVQKRHRRLLESAYNDSGPLIGPAHTDHVSPRFTPIQPVNYAGFNMAFWDLETTDLKALMGRILACSVADVFGNVKTFRADETVRENIIDDRELAVMVRDYLEQFDILVSWNGKLFDKPFLNARLMEAGERPIRADLMHIDLMYYAKGQFMKIGSAKLDNVQRFLDSGTQKTPITWKEWQLAAAGDRKAMDTVVEHCEADVLVLREVFQELKQLVRVVHR